MAWKQSERRSHRRTGEHRVVTGEHRVVRANAEQQQESGAAATNEGPSLFDQAALPASAAAATSAARPFNWSLVLAALGAVLAIAALVALISAADSFLPPATAFAWILPALLAIPVVGAVATIFTRSVPAARRAALITLGLELTLSLALWVRFDPNSTHWQFALSRPWINAWGVHFAVGLDGVGLAMVLLTTALMPITVLAGWNSIKRRAPQYYALVLVLTTGMLGVFMATDLFLFYVMWEVLLVPMYFIVGGWGGDRRLSASVKFFVFTMAGSLVMLLGVLYVGFHGGGTGPGHTPSFAFDDVARWTATLPHPMAILVFTAFALAFAIKVPLFPLHTWLPDTYAEAPVGGTVILSGIMAKLGAFGFIRLAMPLFPAAALDPVVRGVILSLAVVSILYGALVALVQPDFKRLIAYSSVSHLGFVVLGLFALTVQSVQGAILVMINHAISTGALFLLGGMLAERGHSRLVGAYGGLARTVPLFAAILTFVSLSSIGLPGTNGFVGEFLVLTGSFTAAPFFVLFATAGVIFAAAYMLWSVQRILFDRSASPTPVTVDLNWREVGLLTPLLVAILWLGIYPAPVLRRTEMTASTFVTRVTHGAGPEALHVFAAKQP
jgi:NADH-quinone oxidoreductase subunit M